MDYEYTGKHKPLKPIPGGATEDEYRLVIHKIMEGMTKNNLKAALFLCKDDIPYGREIETSLQFFRYLEDRDLVSQENASYIAEVLHIIKRMDLLKIIPCIKNKRHFEEEYLSYSYRHFSNYRVLTIQLLDELSQKDFEKFRYHCSTHLRNRSLEECTDVLMLLRKLEEQDVIDQENFTDLITILERVENAKPLKLFQRLLDGDETVAIPAGKQSQQTNQQAAFADRRNAQQRLPPIDDPRSIYQQEYGHFPRVEPAFQQAHYQGVQPIPDDNITIPKGNHRTEKHPMHHIPNDGNYASGTNYSHPGMEKGTITYEFDGPGPFDNPGRSMARGFSQNGKCFSSEESMIKQPITHHMQRTQTEQPHYGRFRSMPQPSPTSPYQTNQTGHYSDDPRRHLSHHFTSPVTPPPSYQPEDPCLPRPSTYPRDMRITPDEFRYADFNRHQQGRQFAPNRYQEPQYYGPQHMPLDRPSLPYYAAQGQIPPQGYSTMPHFDLSSPPEPQSKQSSVASIERSVRDLKMSESASSTNKSDVKCILNEGTIEASPASTSEPAPRIQEGAWSVDHQKEMEELRKKNQELHDLLQQQKSVGSYNMDNSPVGICVIINNEHYEKNFNSKEFTRRQGLNNTLPEHKRLNQARRGLKDRTGTHYDAEALEELFESFDFEVKRYDNQDQRNIIKIYKDIAGLDHSKYNCFLMVILAHGDNGCIYGVDSFPVKIPDIQVEFCADGCPSLANKPKIFLIQACQGARDMLSLSHRMPEADVIVTDAPQPETINDRSTPNKADFLLAYSTVPGFVSYRVKGKGTYFIMKIVDVFNGYFETQDLLSMMIMVNNECSKYKEKTQVPMPVPTLRKKVFFHRKEGWVPKEKPEVVGPSTSAEDNAGPSSFQPTSAEFEEERRSTIQQVTGEQYD